MSSSIDLFYHLSLERFTITYARPHLGLFLSQSDNLFQDATLAPRSSLFLQLRPVDYARGNAHSSFNMY